MGNRKSFRPTHPVERFAGNGNRPTTTDTHVCARLVKLMAKLLANRAPELRSSGAPCALQCIVVRGGVNNAMRMTNLHKTKSLAYVGRNEMALWHGMA